MPSVLIVFTITAFDVLKFLGKFELTPHSPLRDLILILIVPFHRTLPIELFTVLSSGRLAFEKNTSKSSLNLSVGCTVCVYGACAALHVASRLFLKRLGHKWLPVLKGKG